MEGRESGESGEGGEREDLSVPESGVHIVSHLPLSPSRACPGRPPLGPSPGLVWESWSEGQVRGCSYSALDPMVPAGLA